MPVITNINQADIEKLCQFVDQIYKGSVEGIVTNMADVAKAIANAKHIADRIMRDMQS